MVLLLLTGCAASETAQPSSPDRRARLIEQAHGEIVVRAVALGAEESEAAFGIDLNALDIQPVWIEIENGHPHGFWLFPHAIDEDYFPPYEAARRAAQFTTETTTAIYARLDAAQIPFFVPPGSSVRGFVCATDDKGAKAFSVELHGPERTRLGFHFLSPLPGRPDEYLTLPQDRLTDPQIPSLDDDGLRRWIKTEAPATTRAADGAAGDPLNIVLVYLKLPTR